MRTVQMTLDEDLVRTVDRVVRDLHTTRSAFARDALYRAIESIRTAKLEDKHRQGYLRKPVGAGEFDDRKGPDRRPTHPALDGPNEGSPRRRHLRAVTE
jgi:hypothetical protein